MTVHLSEFTELKHSLKVNFIIFLKFQIVYKTKLVASVGGGLVLFLGEERDKNIFTVEV